MRVGIDLGGTNIAIGLVDETGNIIKKTSSPTPSLTDYKLVVKTMAEMAMTLVSDAGFQLSDIKAVGIGTPGSIDYDKNIVLSSNNLKMSNARVAEEFQKYWNIPVALENDANAAALGEYVMTGNGSKVFVAVTLGTGVGGGIIINGEIFKGYNGAAGELGHMVIISQGETCTCGRKGCWEAYASATALIKQTKKAIEEHPESIMSKIAEEYGKINGRVAFDAAKQGDKIAQNVVDTYISYVSEGIVNIINMLQPDKIVIGGGISNEGEYLINKIYSFVEKYDYNRGPKHTQIETAKLLNDAGIIGAAFIGK